MNQIDGILILLFLPLALLLCGYWLAALLTDNTAGERLAFAVLSGLVLMLAAVATVNLFRPLNGFWAYACLLPGLPSLLPRFLSGLGRDFRAVLRLRPTGVALALAAYLGLLLWPVLRAPASLFYDGTSNHDSFFWIAGAEHLKRHTYLEMPTHTPTQPLMATATAIVGWRPAWGRMGAEGLLALASSVINVSPIKLYLYATACLYFAWLAGAWLALRTFVTDQPRRGAIVALAGLQPLFAFFYDNNNLPNLLGALTGTAFLLAFERALRTRDTGWAAAGACLALVALSFHGLLCVYPEMTPFVLIPAGLLWLRRWFTTGFRPGCRPCGFAAGAIVLGVALNPATSVRAYHGFVASFGMARADENWANLFNPLGIAEYVPGLVSLSVTAARQLGPWLGWPLSAMLLVGAGMVVHRARDRFGLLAVFAGSGALLLYTLGTGFAYGWQKTAQFSGVMVGMVFPAAVVHVLLGVQAGVHRVPRLLARLGLVAIPAFLAFATAMTFRETYKWSERKVISSDWFALRDLSRTTLRDAPVLVEAATFPMSFFHGMWSAYFLSESRLYFGARGDQSGGYLRSHVVNEAAGPIPAPAAILVGRRWADTFDSQSPRLLTGREFVLLQQANRVHDLTGVSPLNGPPEQAATRFSLRLTPADSATLGFELSPRHAGGPAAGVWQVRGFGPDGPGYRIVVSGAPPWRFDVPLRARLDQTVNIEWQPSEGTSAPTEDHPFTLSGLRITPPPPVLSPVMATIDFAGDGAWAEHHVDGLFRLPDGGGVITSAQRARLRFTAPPASDDIALQLIAEPHAPTGSKAAPLATELWFNGTLVFTGFFFEPGVLRARILVEQWNQRPITDLELRFPGNPDSGPRLRLKTLLLERTTTPRP